MITAEILSDPQILCGKPVIAGTRISVELILDKLGAGDSIPEILLDYPHLNRDQILSAIRYASHSLRHHSLIALPPAKLIVSQYEFSNYLI